MAATAAAEPAANATTNDPIAASEQQQMAKAKEGSFNKNTSGTLEKIKDRLNKMSPEARKDELAKMKAQFKAAGGQDAIVTAANEKLAKLTPEEQLTALEAMKECDTKTKTTHQLVEILMFKVSESVLLNNRMCEHVERLERDLKTLSSVMEQQHRMLTRFMVEKRRSSDSSDKSAAPPTTTKTDESAEPPQA